MKLSCRNAPINWVGIVCAIFGCLGLSQPVKATNYYWDTNGATAGAGSTPTGTWDNGITTSWTTDPTGLSITSAATTQLTDSLFFVAGPSASSGNNPFTVTISGSVAALSLNFQSSGLATFNGGTSLTLGAGGINIPQFAYGGTNDGGATINTAIILNANQSWTNNSTATLTIGAGGIDNGANLLTIAGSGNTTIAGVIGNGATVSGGLTKLGAGTLTLSGANLYTGATTVNQGSMLLDLSAGGSLNSLSALSLGVSGSFTLKGAASGTSSQTVNGLTITSGGVSLTINANGGSGTLLTLGAIGRTPTSGGTIDFTQPGGVISASNGFTTTTTNGPSGTILGQWATVGGVDYATNNGANIVALGNATSTAASGWNSSTTDYTNNVTGTTTLAASALANTLRFIGATAQTIDLGATFSLTSLGYLNNSTAGALTIARASGTGTVVLSAGNDTVFNTGANGITVSAPISGSGNLVKTGSGTLTLSGANTFTGTTTLNAGTLSFSSDSSFGTAPASLNPAAIILNGGTITNSAVVTLSANRGITINGNVTINDGANNFSPQGGLYGPANAVLTITGATYVPSTGATAGTFAGNVILKGTIIPQLGSVFTGSTLTSGIFGVGTVTFSTGVIFRSSSGTAADYTIGNALVFGDPTLTIQLGGQKNVTFSGAGTLTSNLTIASTASTTQTYAFTGAINDNGGNFGITVNSVGLIALGTPLGGASTFTGGVTNSTTNGGAVVINNGAALGTGTFIINAGAGIDTTTSNFVLTNNNAQTWNGSFAYIGSQNLNLGTGAVTLTSTPTITTTANTLTVGGIISGTGFGLSKAGAGTLALVNANVYTGPTAVTAGALALGSATVSTGSILTTSSISVSGGTLKLDNTAGNADRILDTRAITLLTSGELNLTGNSATNTTETFGVLGLSGGSSVVTVVSGAGRVTTLNPASVSRTNSSTALVRGSSLDQSLSTNVSQIVLGDGGSSLVLVGANTLNNGAASDATQALKIVPYLIGDTSVGNNGKGFVTYDATLGLRVLNTNEYTALVAGYTTAANPDNALAGTNVTLTNLSGIVVNSLLFNAAATSVLNSINPISLTVNSGAVASLTAAAQSNTIGSGFSVLNLDNSEGIVTVASNAGTSSLTIATPIDVTSGGVHTANGAFVKSGAGTLILAATNLYTGTTTVNQGTLQIGNGLTGNLAAGSGAITTASPATLSINLAPGDTLANTIVDNGTISKTLGANANTLAGNISGTGTVAVGLASSTLILSGSNSYTGATSVTAGTLQLQNANAVASSTVTLSTNTILQLRSDSGGTQFVAGGSKILLASGASVTIDVDKLSTGAGNTLGIQSLALSGNQTVIFTNNGGNANYNLAIGNALTVAAAGTETYTNNMVNGTTAIAGGVTLSNTATQNITFNGNSASATTSFGAIVSGGTTETATFSKSGLGTLILTGGNTALKSSIAISSGTLIAANAGALGAATAVTVSAGANLTYAATTTATLTSSVATTTVSIVGGTGTTIGGSIGTSVAGAAITFGGAATTSGAVKVNVYGIAGATPVAGTNTYSLVTAASGLNNATYSLGTVYNATNFTVSPTIISSATALQVSITSAAVQATEYWKGGLTNNVNVWAASDGSANSNWTTDSAGAVNTSLTPGAATSVIFSANNATNQTSMVLGSNMSIAGLTVDGSTSPPETNNILVNSTGNTLTLGTGGINVLAGSGTVTFNNPITLGGIQSWANNSSSTLSVGGAVANGGFLLTVAGSGNTSLGAISGAGGLINISTGILTLGGAMTYTGATTLGTASSTTNVTGIFGNTAIALSNGTLSLQNVAALNQNTLTITGGTLAETVDNAIGGTAAVTLGAGGGLTLSRPNTYSGNTTINAGTNTTLTITNAGGAGVSSLNFATGATTPKLNLHIDGAGSNGLIAMANSIIGNTGIVTTIDVANNGSGNTNNVIQLNGSGGTGLSTATLNITGSNGYSLFIANIKEIAGAAGTLTFNPTTAALSLGNLIGAAAQAYIFDLDGTNANNSVTGAITTGQATSVAVTKSNTSTWTLSGASTYTGATLISGGTLRIGNGGTSGSLSTSSAITDNGTLAFNRSNAVSQGVDFTASAISGSGGLSQLGSGTLTLSAANTYTGATTISGGVLSTGASGVLANGGTASSIGKSANTAAGLIINGGSLQYANTGAAEVTDRLFTIGSSGAMLDASGTNSITFNGNGSGSANAIAFAGTNTSPTLTLTGTGSGILAPIVNNNGSGTTSVTMTGAGSWALSGANTYTGATSINSGTLIINTVASGAAAQSLGEGSTVNLGVPGSSSGILQFTGAGGVTLDKNINALGNGNDAISNTGGGSLTLSGTLTKNGTTLTLNSGAGSAIIVSGQITGAASGSDLLISGPGTTTLSNPNNGYNGPTSINGGATLLVNGTTSGVGTGLVTVKAGGTLGGIGTIVAPVTVNAGGSSGGVIRGGDSVNNSYGNLSINGTMAVQGGANGGTIQTQVTSSGGSITNSSLISLGTNPLNLSPTGGKFNINILDTGNTLTTGSTYTINLVNTSGNINLFNLGAQTGQFDQGSFVNANTSTNGTYANVTINGSGFANSTSNWTLGVNGNNLVLMVSPTATPEPHHLLLICAGALGLGVVIRRRYVRGAASVA